LNHDGRVLAVTDHTQGQLVVLDLLNKKVLLRGMHRGIDGVSLSPDGHWVAGSTWGEVSGKVRIWEVSKGEVVAEVANGPVAFSPDSQWLVVGEKGFQARKVDSWRKVEWNIQHDTNQSVNALCYSPDGNMLAAGPWRGAVRLFDSATGSLLATLSVPAIRLNTNLAFSPDGSFLAVCCQEVIQLWDLRLIRRQLREMGLDWDLPPYPPAAERKNDPPLKAEVNLGELVKLTPTPEEHARQAIEKYRRAVETNPNDAAARNNLAWLYVTAPEPLRDPKQALPLAQKAVELAPENPVYRNTLGLAYYRTGQYRQAVDTLQPNLKSQEDRFLAFDLYFLAMSLQQLGETAKAQEHYNWAVRWSQVQKNLSPQHVEELNAFRAEAETLLKEARP
jgi:hypothetical protein